MTTENKEYLEEYRPHYNRLIALASWDNIQRSGQLQRFDAFRIRDIMQEESNPNYGCDIHWDPGAVLNMLHDVYRLYDRQYRNE